MTHEEALRKVQACLRLATSSNPNEAALAAAKAQEIMDRYQISESALAVDGKAEDEEIIDCHDPVAKSTNGQHGWTGSLCVAVGSANGCKVYRRNGAGSVEQWFLIGSSRDISTSRYMIGFFTQQVMDISGANTKGWSGAARRDYRSGVVDAIREKLAAQRKATRDAVRSEAGNPLALIKVNNAIAKLDSRLSAIEAWVKGNMRLKKARQSSANTNWSARTQGLADGREQIRLTKASGSLTSGSEKIEDSKGVPVK